MRAHDRNGRRGRWWGGGWRVAAAAVVCLGGLSSAAMDVPHDVVDLGVYAHEINSVGAVLGVDDDGWFILDPDGSTKYRPTLPEGWAYLQLRGLTDPLDAGGIGVAWGDIDTTGGADVAPVVWDPLGDLTVVPMPESAAVGAVVGVAKDGFVYVETSTTWNWAGPEHVGDVFAAPLSDLGARTTIPHVDGYESVRFLRWQWEQVWVQAYNVGDGWVGPRYVWDRASNTTADADPAIDATRSGWVASQIDGSALDTGAWFGSSNLSGHYWNLWPVPTSVLLTNIFTEESYDLTADLAAAGAYSATPHSVSEDGLVVGHMWLTAEAALLYEAPPTHVFVWDPAHGLVDLSADVLPEAVDESSYPLEFREGAFVEAFNESGKVVFAVGPETWAWLRSGEIDGVAQLEGMVPETTWGASGYWFTQGAPYSILPRRMNVRGQYLGRLANGNVAIATPHGATDPGDDVQVRPNATTTITFDGIVASGETVVFTYDVDDPAAPDAPLDFALAGTGTLINIATTAAIAEGSSIRFAIAYDDTGMSAGRENQVRLLHYEDDRWVDVTDYGRPGGYLDTTNNIVYGVTTSLSPFAVVLPTTVRGAIDVRPGSSPNPIQLSSKGRVPVAVLGQPGFYPATLDPESVVFAGASVSRRPNGTLRYESSDVNEDGRDDVVYHFEVQDLHLTSSDTSATLTATTEGGVPFEASDAVSVSGN